MNTHRRLINLSRKSGILFSLVVLTGFILTSLVVLQSWQLSWVINGVFLRDAGVNDVLLPLKFIFLIILFRAGFTFVNGWLSGLLAEKIKFELRQLLLKKIDRLGPMWLRRQKTGEVATTLLQGVDSLDSYFSQFLPQVLLAAAIPLVILFVVFPLDLLTAIVFLVTAPLIPIFMILIGRMAASVTQRQWQKMQQMGDFLLDSIRGLKTLLLLGRSRDRLNEIQRVSEEYRISTINVLKVTLLSAFSLELIATIATAVVAVEIGLRLLYGQLDFQHAFFILLLAPEFYLPMRNLSMRYHAGMAGVTAAASIYKILDIPEVPYSTIEMQDKTAPDFSKNPLVLRSVSYNFEDSAVDVLTEINFEFSPGRHYAIVGENGAGKSTLLNLLMQFVQPQDGEIEVSGQDSRLWSAKDWRNSISWVGQKPVVFNASLLENVRLFNSAYSEEQVIDALSQAGFGELVRSLPQGLATPMLETGARLSSGERQRLALARAFLKEGSLILMDEATSHLDITLSQFFLSSLERLIKNRTSIIVAHHKPLMKMADEVLVLKRGRLVQHGPYQALIDQGGYFADLVKAGEA